MLYSSSIVTYKAIKSIYKETMVHSSGAGASIRDIYSHLYNILGT